MTTPGWENILSEGEEILWQGQPDRAISLRPVNPMQIVMGLFATAFAIFWISMALSMVDHRTPWFFRNLFPAFGLIFVAFGLYQAGGYAIVRAMRARSTWYTLTNRHAIIATNHPLQGKRLKSYPIDATTALEFDGGFPGTITFAQETRRGNNGTTRVPIGFERINDANEVWHIMRDIQTGGRT